MSKTDEKIRDILKLEVEFHPEIGKVHCNTCGTRLKVYYAEEKTYAVKCGYCEYIGIVKEKSPMRAAFHFGREQKV